jgi:hypothetical protein
VPETLGVSERISRLEAISFRSSFICRETIMCGLIPKLQVITSLKPIGPPGTVRVVLSRVRARAQARIGVDIPSRLIWAKISCFKVDIVDV